MSNDLELSEVAIPELSIKEPIDPAEPTILPHDKAKNNSKIDS
jgi:hypothetical protein